jgi:hydrogenase maturation protease
MTREVLVAGVGNIFLGDDAFGCEVVRALGGAPLPEGVEVVDFGIRGVHLAYQLLDGYDLVVLVDAAPRGRPPGTVSLLDVDTARIGSTVAAVSAGDAALLDVHGMAPGAILTTLASLGGRIEHVLVVACEPESVAERLGLSDVVRAAVPHAVRLVQQVVDEHVAEARRAAKEVSNR